MPRIMGCLAQSLGSQSDRVLNKQVYAMKRIFVLALGGCLLLGACREKSGGGGSPITPLPPSPAPLPTPKPDPEPPTPPVVKPEVVPWGQILYPRGATMVKPAEYYAPDSILFVQNRTITMVAGEQEASSIYLGSLLVQDADKGWKSLGRSLRQPVDLLLYGTLYRGDFTIPQVILNDKATFRVVLQELADRYHEDSKKPGVAYGAGLPVVRGIESFDDMRAVYTAYALDVKDLDRKIFGKSYLEQKGPVATCIYDYEKEAFSLLIDTDSRADEVGADELFVDTQYYGWRIMLVATSDKLSTKMVRSIMQAVVGGRALSAEQQAVYAQVDWVYLNILTGERLVGKVAIERFKGYKFLDKPRPLALDVMSREHGIVPVLNYRVAVRAKKL